MADSRSIHSLRTSRSHPGPRPLSDMSYIDEEGNLTAAGIPLTQLTPNEASVLREAAEKKSGRGNGGVPVGGGGKGKPKLATIYSDPATVPGTGIGGGVVSHTHTQHQTGGLSMSIDQQQARAIPPSTAEEPACEKPHMERSRSAPSWEQAAHGCGREPKVGTPEASEASASPNQSNNNSNRDLAGEPPNPLLQGYHLIPDGGRGAPTPPLRGNPSSTTTTTGGGAPRDGINETRI